jgi:bifunctional non-homologous end joining protein LigD
LAAFILPPLKDRPATLKRFPEGVDGKSFYEKKPQSSHPNGCEPFRFRAFARNADALRVNRRRRDISWWANLASVEIHPFLHRAPRIESTTAIVFDLDPGNGADIRRCMEVARLLKQVLHEMKSHALAKVSGSKGIQVYV